MDLRCLRLLSVDKLWRQGSPLTDFLGWSLKEWQPCWVRRERSGEMAMALTANSALNFSLPAPSWNSGRAHTNCMQTWQSSFGKQWPAFPSSLSTLSFEKGSLTEPQLSDHLDWLTISLQGGSLFTFLPARAGPTGMQNYKGWAYRCANHTWLLFGCWELSLGSSFLWEVL